MKPLLVFGALKEYIHFFETPGILSVDILGCFITSLYSLILWGQ